MQVAHWRIPSGAATEDETFKFVYKVRLNLKVDESDAAAVKLTYLQVRISDSSRIYLRWAPPVVGKYIYRRAMKYPTSSFESGSRGSLASFHNQVPRGHYAGLCIMRQFTTLNLPG